MSLDGHRFPGGTQSFEHWENFLLTDCTNRGALSDGLCHPIVAFNMSVRGAGVSIADLFELFGVVDAGAVWLEELDMEFERPLEEGTTYELSGEVESVEPGTTRSGRPFDRPRFWVDMHQPDGELAARVTTTWRILR